MLFELSARFYIIHEDTYLNDRDALAGLLSSFSG